MQPEIIAAARAQMTTQQADIGAFLDQLHEQMLGCDGGAGDAEARDAKSWRAERLRLETEGRAEQKARTRELEAKLNGLIEDFEAQLQGVGEGDRGQDGGAEDCAGFGAADVHGRGGSFRSSSTRPWWRIRRARTRTTRRGRWSRMGRSRHQGGRSGEAEERWAGRRGWSG